MFNAEGRVAPTKTPAKIADRHAKKSPETTQVLDLTGLSEQTQARRHLNELSLQLSSQAAAYGPAYATPGYHPYFYAPPFQVITVVPFGHRGRFGRDHFGRHPHGHPRLPHLWPGHHSPPIYVGPSRGAAGLPRALTPAVRPPRR